MRKLRVLVIDDDPLVVKFLEAGLREESFDVVCAGDGPSGVHMALSDSVDIVVLDFVLPGFDGLEACRRIRAESSVPILMLSVQDAAVDKIRALNLGADDYLSKPFVLEELCARINSILRRSSRGGSVRAYGRIHVGSLSVDLTRRVVSLHDKDVRLTPTEFALMQELAVNAGAVLTQRDLLTRVWGPEYVDDTEYLHVFVSRLRKKIETNHTHPEYLVTVPGVGYILQQPAN